MDEEEMDAPEVLETPELEEETVETPSADEIAQLREKAARADELEEKNKQLFERAKKAETKPKQEGLSGSDAYILAKSDVHQDDVDTVLEWAKFKKLSVSEALADTTLQAVLGSKGEERRTAAATHTTASGRGTAKVSGEDLLLKAEKSGEVPETDEGMQAMFLARLQRKTNKR